MARPKLAKRCSDWWERRTPGKRYVNNRGQCTRLTAHPSGYCSTHRYSYRWTDEQERALQAQPPHIKEQP